METGCLKGFGGKGENVCCFQTREIGDRSITGTGAPRVLD